MKNIFPLFILTPFGLLSQAFEFNTKQNSSAHKGIEYIHLNPAAIPDNNFAIKISGIRKFMLEEYNLTSIDLSLKSSSRDAFAFRIVNFNPSFYNNSIFRIMYNRRIIDDLNLGGGFGFDLEKNFLVTTGLIFSLKDLNSVIGSSMTIQENTLRLNWSFNYIFDSNLSCLISISKITDRKWENEVSLQYRIHDRIELIGGIEPSKYQWFGCIEYSLSSNFNIIFNFRQHGYLGSSPSFSIVYKK